MSSSKPSTGGRGHSNQNRWNRPDFSHYNQQSGQPEQPGQRGQYNQNNQNNSYKNKDHHNDNRFNDRFKRHDNKQHQHDDRRDDRRGRNKYQSGSSNRDIEPTRPVKPKVDMTWEQRADCNLLFKPRERNRTIDICQKQHIPKLKQKKDYKIVLLGDTLFEKLSTVARRRELSSDESESQEYVQKTIKTTNKETGEVEEKPLSDLWLKYNEIGAINLGIAGDGLSDINHRLFQMNVINMLPENPDYIVISAGSYDMNRYTEDVVLDGIINLVREIKKNYKKIKKEPRIVVVGLLPSFSTRMGRRIPRPGDDNYDRYEPEDLISVSDLNRSVQWLNWKLGTVANEEEFDFFDLYFKFYQDNHVLTELYQKDRTSLNEKGYQLFDNYLYPYLTGNESPDKEDVVIEDQWIQKKRDYHSQNKRDYHSQNRNRRY